MFPNLPQFVLIDESKGAREMWCHGIDEGRGIYRRRPYRVLRLGNDARVP
jgi:hypothetical protein